MGRPPNRRKSGNEFHIDYLRDEVDMEDEILTTTLGGPSEKNLEILKGFVSLRGRFQSVHPFPRLQVVFVLHLPRSLYRAIAERKYPSVPDQRASFVRFRPFVLTSCDGSLTKARPA